MKRVQPTSIRTKLIKLTMLVNVVVATMICIVFCVYEYYSFRQRTIQKLEAYSQIIAINSTAALASRNRAEAQDILSALKAEPQIVGAAIYDSKGQLFCRYPANVDENMLPAVPGAIGYSVRPAFIEGFHPIKDNTANYGTLYLKSNLESMYSRFRIFAIVLAMVLAFAFLLAYLLSRYLQKGISEPILALVDTAKAVSERQDYSVRATKSDDTEVGLLTDAFNQMLTEIEKQTLELSEFNHNLEEKISERTQELEAANNELESFSYSVSHDLRAPVRAITSYSEIFLEEYKHLQTDEGLRLLGKIVRNSQKMGIMIDDLLAFSQLGRKELLKTHLPMRELVQHIWDEVAVDLKSPINFELGNLPDVLAERSTMVQVWINLIDNAIKYSSNNSEPTIQISGHQTSQGVVFSIRDNGSGFDMAYYDKLFGVFQRLHSQQEFEGTGVGLAIVERIILRHGGKIWADSKIGEGAAFFFLIP